MKKFKILFVLMMLFSLVACGEVKNSSGDHSGEVENETISMGEWKDNVYTNSFLDMRFRLPEGWDYSSDEEITQLMDISTELAFGEKEYMEKVTKLTSVYYLFASDPNTGSSVSLFTEKPLIDVTMDYYLEQVKSQLAAVSEFKYEIGESTTETLDGKQYTTLQVTVPEYNMIQKYYLRKMERYFIGMIATTTQGDDSIRSIMSHFE